MKPLGIMKLIEGFNIVSQDVSPNIDGISIVDALSKLDSSENFKVQNILKTYPRIEENIRKYGIDVDSIMSDGKIQTTEFISALGQLGNKDNLKSSQGIISSENHPDSFDRARELAHHFGITDASIIEGLAKADAVMLDVENKILFTERANRLDGSFATSVAKNAIKPTM